MRTSPLEKNLAAAGAVFGERHGVRIAERVLGPEAEYCLVRDSVAASDASHMQRFIVPEASAIDALDPLLAGNAARIRFGRMLHTFMADENGRVIADCYAANNDENYLLLCESIAPDSDLRRLVTGAHPEIRDITDTTAAISLDGCKAWAVVKELFGADVLGLPYLSIETYEFGGEKISLMRAGKTSEFGYLLMTPAQSAPKLFEAIMAILPKHGGGICGADIHNDLRLEGRFFNVFAEGAIVGDPLELGLQWMIDFGKDSFRGRDAIFKRREQGLKRKITGILAGAGDPMDSGDPIFEDKEAVGEVITVCQSYALGRRLGLAMLPAGIAYPGLCFKLKSLAGPEAQTVSMPPITPKSLSVKLDEL